MGEIRFLRVAVALSKQSARRVRGKRRKKLDKKKHDYPWTPCSKGMYNGGGGESTFDKFPCEKARLIFTIQKYEAA